MAERVASVVAQFKADLSEAESSWEKFKSKVEGSRLNVPVSPAFGGGGSGAGGGGGGGSVSTLGGMTVASSGTLPAFMSSASLNLPMLLSQAVQQLTPQMSPNWGGIMQSSPTGASSPNWSYLLNSRAAPGVPRSPGMGGMRALFAGGMIAHSALGVADASREYGIESSLAGNSFAGQYEASRSYRKRLTGSIPFIGGAFDLMEDPSGSEEAGGRLAIQSSKDLDAQTSGMRSAFASRTRLSDEYNAMAAPAGYLRNKAEIESRFGPLSRMGQQDMRNKEVEPLDAAHKGNRSEIERKFGAEISSIYGASGAGPGVGANMAGQAGDLARQLEEALKAEDDSYHAAVKIIDDRYANIDKLRDAAHKSAAAANERSRRADLNSLRRRSSGGYTGPRGALVDRMMHGQDLADPGDPELNKRLRDADAADLSRFDMVSGNRFSTTTATNMMRARGDAFGAKMRAAGGVAFAEWAEADQTQGGAALLSGFSGMYATLMEGMSSTSLAASGFASGADANALLLARNPMGAQLKRLQTARDAVLFPFRNSTMPGAGLLRSGVNRFFGSQEDLLRQQYGDEDARINLHLSGEREGLQSLLRHDVVGAQVAGIVTSGLDQATQYGNVGKISQQRDELNNSLLKLQLTKQNFVESFHATEIGQNFDTGSPRGTASMEQIMKDIQGGIDKLTTALKDVAAAK
jgi:hypothetical protein